MQEKLLPEILKRNIIPDILTDQTSAHDTLNGYVPMGMSFDQAKELRKSKSSRIHTSLPERQL